LDVEQFKDVRKEDFVEKYTSLVQRLSLLLLQVMGAAEGHPGSCASSRFGQALHLQNHNWLSCSRKFLCKACNHN
jgi:hypothetical protein